MMNKEICFPCERGSHNLCLNEWEPCSCDHQQEKHVEADRLDPDENRHGRKNDYDLKDPQSTGRKRAAKLFPLDPEGECEFANKRDAGAIPGLQGIDGCGIRSGTKVGNQQARHHLDYDTLNNSILNVVRICHSCHVQLHHVNDPNKDKFYESKYGAAAARGLQRGYKKLKDRPN